MNNKMLMVQMIFFLICLFSVGSRADILSQLGDLGKFGQCGVEVNNDPEFSQCKEKVTDNWKAETNPKKQACCKPMAFLDCTIKTAKTKCSESDVKFMESSQKTVLNIADKSCIVYRENPSMCGTCALLPVLSLILISIMVAFKIA